MSDWQNSAACAGLDPNLFFPIRGDGGPEAKAVCATCRVREACGTYALDNGIKHGIWGGMGERTRKRLRAARNRQNAITEVAS